VADIIVRAFGLVLVVALGYGLKRWGFLSASDFPTFSKLVLTVTLPCALATSFNTVEVVPALLGLSLFAFVVNVSQQMIGAFIGRHRTPVERGFLILHGGSYNIGAFVLPYISAFAGPQVLVQTALYDVGQSLGSAGVGRSWAHSVADHERRTTIGTFLQKMFSSPVFVAYLVFTVQRLLHITLPGPIIAVTSLVGAANPFLAMLMIGIGLEIRLSRMKYAAAAAILSRRYLISVLLTVLVWFLFPWDREVKVTVTMLLFGPFAAMISGFTSEIDGDVELSTFVTSVSIIIAIVMIPLIYLVGR
jgi:predicted permease